jgi:hypothetical protein
VSVPELVLRDVRREFARIANPSPANAASTTSAISTSMLPPAIEFQGA